MKDFINIEKYYICIDAIRIVFDTIDSIGKPHAAIYVGGNTYHKFYNNTAKEIYDLIEKAKKEV